MVITWFLHPTGEGGYGGFDLYYSKYENNAWTDPLISGARSIPPTMNTARYVFFSVFLVDDILFRPARGKGGFDLYCVDISDVIEVPDGAILGFLRCISGIDAYIEYAKISVFWFRRDLRLEDNRGLQEALRTFPRLPIFIFLMKTSLPSWEADDPRITFIHRTSWASPVPLKKAPARRCLAARHTSAPPKCSQPTSESAPPHFGPSEVQSASRSGSPRQKSLRRPALPKEFRWKSGKRFRSNSMLRRYMPTRLRTLCIGRDRK